MRLLLLAAILLAIVSLAVAALADGGSSVTVAESCAVPTPIPVPNDAVTICRESGPPADGLYGFAGGTAQTIDIQVSHNASGCPEPTIELGRVGPDFQYDFTVDWGVPCVDASEYIELSFACRFTGTPQPCDGFGGFGCANWTVGGEIQGSPCPTPDCGGVPCCNGLPCPTPTHPPQATKIAVSPGTPGDYDCDEFISLGDAIRLQAELADVPLPALGHPCSVPTGGQSSNVGDSTCDGLVDIRDVLAILQILVQLRVPSYCS